METRADHLIEDRCYGLTKREHMAIEFTKSSQISHPNFSNDKLARYGIELADELIKQLNQTKTQ